MSLRLAMRTAARAARSRLPDGGAAAAGFLRSRRAEDGGFRGRAARSDLYYTAFAVEALAALGADPPPGLADYLRRFGTGASLDFIHIACLARSWASLDLDGIDPKAPGILLDRMREYGAAGGGFHHAKRGAARGTAYGCFLAVGLCEDLGADLPDSGAILSCLAGLRLPDGAYANEPGRSMGLTPATAAATTLLAHLEGAVAPETPAWIRAHHRRSGGFAAATLSPIADLLSTATALHALAACGEPLDDLREPCARFVEGLRGDTGGFCGHRFDRTADCEYTWYGLLALGHLSAQRVSDGDRP
ncbi:MAG: hypothetical protein JXP34_04065 [Planctomycetes bacterium]|nr:hypothetical protein [Planctomycetota bacterium]